MFETGKLVAISHDSSGALIVLQNTNLTKIDLFGKYDVRLMQAYARYGNYKYVVIYINPTTKYPIYVFATHDILMKGKVIWTNIGKFSDELYNIVKHSCDLRLYEAYVDVFGYDENCIGDYAYLKNIIEKLPRFVHSEYQKKSCKHYLYGAVESAFVEYEIVNRREYDDLIMLIDHISEMEGKNDKI